ncbi:hypothetical protein V3I01_01000 [Sphingomonas sp. gentR]|jgi:hypothetical protein|uniref:hypothetical protein n=1 Tax=unclassified Sphingomonas TaxID=196159 RepID=UPI000972A1FA|nr:hypothetical protein [Sphingomonas sp. LK11]APX65152.1 hypothetical protein AV944_04025 [Sphingomonas sp. LK11]
MLLLLIALQASPAPPPKPAAEKVVCKKVQETGSFLKFHKTCLTTQQWRRIGEANQGAARNVVTSGAGVPGANLTGAEGG